MTRAPLGLLVLILALAACAGDDGPAEDAADVAEETAAGSQPDASGEDPAITIEDFTFTAGSTAAGASVTVRNDDGAGHTVTADDGSFDVAVSGGASETFTAPDEPGTYGFTCTIHPTMTAELIVE